MAVPSHLARTPKATHPAPSLLRVGFSALVCLIGLAFGALAYTGWIQSASQNPVTKTDKDYRAFDKAADRAIDGDWEAVYRDSADERWPYLYPPYAIPIALPLAAFDPWPSYLVSLVTPLLLAAVSVTLLARARRAQLPDAAAFAGAVAGCGPLFSTAVTGQYSGIYLIGLAVWVAALVAGRHRLAGASLGLLLVKPNLAAPFAVVTLLRGNRGERQGLLAAGVVALVGAALTGPAVVSAFVAALGRTFSGHAGADVPTDKEVTLLAALRVATGSGAMSSVALALWLVAVALLGLAVARRVRAGVDRERVARLAGIAVLFAVTANLRLYFYDAVVLVVPAAAWMFERRTYASAASRRCIGAILAALFVVTWSLSLPVKVTYLAGPLTALWLVVELVDLARGEPRLAVGELAETR